MVLPLFQFDFAGGCVRSDVALVISELSDTMNNDDMARWLLQPNGWLNGAVPADICTVDVPAVLAAARADRWAVKG